MVAMNRFSINCTTTVSQIAMIVYYQSFNQTDNWSHEYDNIKHGHCQRVNL